MAVGDIEKALAIRRAGGANVPSSFGIRGVESLLGVPGALPSATDLSALPPPNLNATLDDLVSQLGPGIQPGTLNLPKPPLALPAGGGGGALTPPPPPMGGMGAAASGGGMPNIMGALPAAGGTSTARSVLDKGLAGKAKGLFRNPMAGGGGLKGLAKAAWPGLALSIGGNYVAREIGGDVGDILGGAATGAGFGLAFGPAGAAVGGLGGGLLSLLSKDDNESPEDVVKRIVAHGDFDEEQKSMYLAQYEILKETSGEEVALQTIGQQIVTDMAAKEQAKQQQMQLLATQALTAQFFQPFTKELIESAQTRAGIGERLAEQLPENYRAIARTQNAASLDNATRTANAYAAQAQILPAMAAMQQQQQIADQLAQQQAAAVMQQVGGNVSSGGVGVGGGGLQELLAQLGG